MNYDDELWPGEETDDRDDRVRPWTCALIIVLVLIIGTLALGPPVALLWKRVVAHMEQTEKELR